MSENVQIILIGTAYRTVCVLVALGFCYMGYQLYVKGVFEKEGEISGQLGKNKLILRHVAPGVAFVVLGVIVGALGVTRPISIIRQAIPAMLVDPELAPIEKKLEEGKPLTPSESKSFSDWLLRSKSEAITVTAAYGTKGHWWEFWKWFDSGQNFDYK